MQISLEVKHFVKLHGIKLSEKKTLISTHSSDCQRSIVGVFYVLFGCPTANFGSFSPYVTHYVIHSPLM